MENKMENKMKIKQEHTTEFLKFCYNFPMNIKDLMIDVYGEMAEHFYKKFIYYTEKYSNNFIGMVYMYIEMTDNNKIKFHELISKYNNEQINR